eukprot:CAMPEP_0185723562 /NCGR_PEP_ID=MMETSP1171-20130828/365_1 /TAXON_ID=374046 /ORGANISM="Helicotheca tamensis, Strain CCMP826" /LENGTH=434 /DNA_ID=CAMNT_0028391283 /DNA_START=327 /DNA_END=1631 /DNA_ORIENTATION=-
MAKQAQPAWAKKASVQRAEILKKMASIIRENRLELIDILVKEQAKILPLATVEIDVTAVYLDYHAGLARSIEGEILPSDNVGEHIYVHRAPIGVSVGICPWNFPFFVMARKIAPALLAGCTVVVKSSEVTPLTCFRFAELMTEAIEAGELELEPGVLSILTGYGSTIGEALTNSPVPDIISMTGSTAVGQQIMANAAKHMTKVSLELGGKAPVIVMEDCDLDKTVDAIVASRVIFTGQVCNCAERVYVQSSIYDKFLEKLVAKMESCEVGAPRDEPAPACCGFVSKAQLDKVVGMVDRAKEAGAKVHCGGSAIDGPGYRYSPTVLTNVDQKSEIVQKEVFGPVLPVMSFDTFDEALELANDCEYGLSSSLFTNDYRLIERARTELLFGETYINRFHFEAIQGFHAGWRKSGLGGADGKHGLLEYLSTKVVYVQQ